MSLTCNIMNISWIDEYINGVTEYCCSRDIFEIYDSLNINIKKVDKNDLLLRGNDAVYIRNFLGIEAVFIRDDLPYQYEKFVLTHNLDMLFYMWKLLLQLIAII